jgi:hypothetical protein
MDFAALSRRRPARYIRQHPVWQLQPGEQFVFAEGDVATGFVIEDDMAGTFAIDCEGTRLYCPLRDAAGKPIPKRQPFVWRPSPDIPDGLIAREISDADDHVS